MGKAIKTRNVDEMRNLLDTMNFINIQTPKLHPLDFRVNHGLVSFDNPISIYFSKHESDTDFINEGLIKTYPIDDTINFIIKYFNLDPNTIKKQTVENGKQHIVVRFPNIENNLKIMSNAMTVCGYNMGAISSMNIIDDVPWITVQYEAKFQNDDSAIIRKNETHLYHITPIYNEEKILKDGFSPHCKNKIFNYSDRIYFIKGSADDGTTIQLGYELYKTNISKGNNGLYTIFDIGINKIPHNTQMYLDPNFPQGIFISNNIHPKSIIRTGHIDFNKNNPKIIWK